MKENKHVRKYREKHLKAGETILACSDGYIGDWLGKDYGTQKIGALIVTEQKVIFYRAGVFGEINESIPLKSITSIERKTVLLVRTIRLHTSHDDLEFKTMNKDEERLVIEAIEANRNGSSERSTVNVDPVQSPLEKIKQLAELKDAGVLTEDEFQQKKAELMSQV